jgi:hypothetical protein
VWALRRTRGIDASHLVEHPVVGRVEALHMQTWATSLLC